MRCRLNFIHLFALLAVCGAALTLTSANAATSSTAASDRSGQVYLLRHALAPGSGDPPGMQLDDPTTQRNLNNHGRQQAKEIGVKLRAAGITQAKVYSSQWWRCLETAQLLGFDEPIPHSGLNSFWQRREQREPILADFKRLVDGLPDDGPPIIFVTHYVNIQAVTGQAVGSGSGIWVPLSELR